MKASRKTKKNAIPGWAPYAAVITLTMAIILTVNFRAYTEYSKEEQQNQQLKEKIEVLREENLLIQEETHYLKTDPKAIERDARRLGLRPKKDPKKEKVSEPTK